MGGRLFSLGTSGLGLPTRGRVSGIFFDGGLRISAGGWVRGTDTTRCSAQEAVKNKMIKRIIHWMDGMCFIEITPLTSSLTCRASVFWKIVFLPFPGTENPGHRNGILSARTPRIKGTDMAVGQFSYCPDPGVRINDSPTQHSPERSGPGGNWEFST